MSFPILLAVAGVILLFALLATIHRRKIEVAVMLVWIAARVAFGHDPFDRGE